VIVALDNADFVVSRSNLNRVIGRTRIGNDNLIRNRIKALDAGTNIAGTITESGCFIDANRLVKQRPGSVIRNAALQIS